MAYGQNAPSCDPLTVNFLCKNYYFYSTEHWPKLWVGYMPTNATCDCTIDDKSLSFNADLFYTMVQTFLVKFTRCAQMNILCWNRLSVRNHVSSIRRYGSHLWCRRLTVRLLLAVRQFFLIGKYSISGSISHNALYYYFGNLVVVLHAKLLFHFYYSYGKNNFVFSLIIYIVTSID